MGLCNLARITLPAAAVVLEIGSAVGQDGSWSVRSPMPTARHGLAVAGLGSLLYAAGGKTGNTCTGLQTLEVYDPAHHRWSTACPPMPTGRFNPAAAALDGKLYVVGGDVGCGSRSDANEVYDPAFGAWLARSPMPTPRTGLGVGAIGGVLYAVGGMDSSNWSAANEAYDPVSDAWVAKASMPAALASIVAVSADGKLYVLGGSGSGGNVDTVEAYDPIADSWSTSCAPMPTLRSSFAGVALDGWIYVVGGFDPTTGRLVATVDAYDPATDTWRTGLASIPTPRAYLAAGVVDGDLYAIGGGPDALVLASNEAFGPSTRFTSLCDPGEDGVIACPCSNPPGGSGRGCDNSASTGGARLSAAGLTFLSADSLVFTTHGEKLTATSILLQGTAMASSGISYGQGVRCVAGVLSPLFTKSASGGSITAPDLAAGDPNVSTRSAAMGDPIQPGQSRWYLVIYRDPTVLGSCAATRTFNATQTGQVTWDP